MEWKTQLLLIELSWINLQYIKGSMILANKTSGFISLKGSSKWSSSDFHSLQPWEQLQQLTVGYWHLKKCCAVFCIHDRIGCIYWAVCLSCLISDKMSHLRGNGSHLKKVLTQKLNLRISLWMRARIWISSAHLKKLGCYC